MTDSSGDISFGTDGWRGVIGRDFTFASVRRVAAAIGRLCAKPESAALGSTETLVVGYDNRFQGREFAREAAEVLSAAVPRVVVAAASLPTPAISFNVKRLGLFGGVVVTASHNPAQYNGVKFKSYYGGSAAPETYAEIASLLDAPPLASRGGAVEFADLVTPYREHLVTLADVERIRRYPMHVLADPMYGAANCLLEEILAGGVCRVTTIHSEANPGFAGMNPEPIEENLGPARQALLAERCDVAVASDGDADRAGLLTETGEYVSAHEMFALLLLYLVRHRGMRGGVAKTFSTTMLLEVMAPRLGIPLTETGIGFKYIAPLMMQGGILMAGEESGGMGFSFNLPERDSLLTQLLILEMMAVLGRPLGAILADLRTEFGRYYYGRRDVHLPIASGRIFVARLRARPPKRIAGEPVTNVRDLDGVKLYFGADHSEGWLLFRVSGTEPMVRLYCEHRNPALVEAILSEAERLLEAPEAKPT